MAMLNGLFQDCRTFDIKHTGMNPTKPGSTPYFGAFTMTGIGINSLTKPGTYDDMDPIKCLDVTVLSDHFT